MAAILYRNGKITRKLSFHLGKAEHHTVYEAELVGLLLGMQLIKTEKRCRTTCALGADNQAAIQALQSEFTKPGQHIAAQVLQTIKRLAKTRGNKNYRLTVRWTAQGTAGHTGMIESQETKKRTRRQKGSGRPKLGQS